MSIILRFNITLHCFSAQPCYEGEIRLQNRTNIEYYNLTTSLIGRPEICSNGIFVPICSSALNNDVLRRVCHSFGSFDGELHLFDVVLFVHSLVASVYNESNGVFDFGRPNVPYGLHNFTCSPFSDTLFFCSSNITLCDGSYAIVSCTKCKEL